MSRRAELLEERRRRMEQRKQLVEVIVRLDRERLTDTEIAERAGSSRATVQRLLQRYRQARFYADCTEEDAILYAALDHRGVTPLDVPDSDSVQTPDSD